MKAVIPAIARALLAPHLPVELAVTWFTDLDGAKAGIADAEIAWVDMQPTARVAETIKAAGPALRWVSTLYAGIDAFPLSHLRERGVLLTNGAGINAVAVAEYAVMAILVAAKRFDEVVRLADRHEWTTNAPGRIELDGTRALVIGMGAIGSRIADRLRAFGVDVVGATRSGRDGTLAADGWKPRLGAFDWVVLCAPATAETNALIDAAALASMKRSAWLVNVARGEVIDQNALIAALKAGTIAGAVLDPTDPEPLPPGHPLWSAPNAIVTMHLSGRSQTKMFPRAATMFLHNLNAFLAGKPMKNVVDLAAGY